MRYKLIIAVLLTILLSCLILLTTCKVPNIPSSGTQIKTINIAGRTYIIMNGDTTQMKPRYRK